MEKALLVDAMLVLAGLKDANASQKVQLVDEQDVDCTGRQRDSPVEASAQQSAGAGCPHELLDHDLLSLYAKIVRRSQQSLMQRRKDPKRRSSSLMDLKRPWRRK